ncbi:MAG TPA: hypothetical protein GX722_09270 [Clostridiales bacterium]|nr:hypothetical protein [Clostridiales bacterium]
MTNKPTSPPEKISAHGIRQVFIHLWRMLRYQWGLKLISLLIAMVLWAGIISQDSALMREKTFEDVEINVTNADVLQRSGLVVVGGLDTLPHLRMRADVPQRIYNSVSASNYNVRIDLSRITGKGEQKVPIIYTSSTTYGTVTWLSGSEVTLQVDEYVTRRRIPVQLNTVGSVPAGFYGQTPTVDPTRVNISGPRSLLEKVVRCVVTYDQSHAPAQAGVQYSALPYTLVDADNKAIGSQLISVTSESVLLDTLLVEQTLHPMKTVDINLSGITSGVPAPGYHVVSVTADPTYVSVAGPQEFLRSLDFIDVDTVISVAGVTEPLIRAVRVVKPTDAQYVSGEVIYVTVQVAKDADTP